MKTMTSAVLGLTLTLAAAGVSFAAQATPATTPDTTAAPMAKKHMKKKNKKARAAGTVDTSATPAPAAKK